MIENYNELVRKCKGRYNISDHGFGRDRVPKYKIVNRKTHIMSVGSIKFLCNIVDEEQRHKDKEVK